MKFSLILLLCWITLVIPEHFSAQDSIQGHCARKDDSSCASSVTVPYQVSVRKVDTNKHVCSGTIINEQWILTAAQCIFGNLPDDFEISVGTNKLNGDGGTTYNIFEGLVHPEYEDHGDNGYDYYLLHTGSNIVFNSHVQPVVLAKSTPEPGSAATFTGWAVSDEPSSVLQQIPLKVISEDRCKEQWPELEFTQLCTLNERAGACSRDTGGPLVVDGKQVGLSSQAGPCAFDVPVLFADTAAGEVYNWIQDNTPVD